MISFVRCMTRDMGKRSSLFSASGVHLLHAVRNFYTKSSIPSAHTTTLGWKLILCSCIHLRCWTGHLLYVCVYVCECDARNGWNLDGSVMAWMVVGDGHVRA